MCPFVLKMSPCYSVESGIKDLGRRFCRKPDASPVGIAELLFVPEMERLGCHLLEAENSMIKVLLLYNHI